MHTPSSVRQRLRDGRNHPAGPSERRSQGRRGVDGEWKGAAVKEARPCGAWTSPLGSADLVRGALRLSTLRLDPHGLYWLEGRPSEGGRQVVMQASIGDRETVPTIRELSPAGSHVRTRVHEYGGGEYAVGRGWLFFVDETDRRLHAGRFDAPARPIAPAGAAYADLVPSPDGRWLLAIEERPREGREPENRLVAFALSDLEGDSVADAGLPMRVVAAGHDFYSSPTFSPRGDRVAWLAWDHPNMPWNGTWLEALEWGGDGPRSSPRAVAGGVSESIFQPRFDRRGRLFAMSDRSGFWNLICVTESGSRPVHRDEAELGRPQWVFGLSSWDFLGGSSGGLGGSSGGLGGSASGRLGEDVGDEAVVASATISGVDTLVRVDLAKGRMTPIDTPFCSISGVVSMGGRVACIAGSPHTPSGIYLWSPGSETPRCLRESASHVLPEAGISRAEMRSFVSPGGRDTHAFVYSPCSTTMEAMPGERPPLLVKSHGGPTAAASAAFDPRIQYWTSRGFAVADVNYSGSSGYGRAYRDRLHEAWGVVDVEDCLRVAEALAETGEADERRLAISGGSAGGYTTLCALTFHDLFAAGASHYGIGDLESLAKDTHKFESRYTDWLVGPLPETRNRYVERSPIHHHAQLSRPVIFFQGLEDRVVPPSQAEAMVAVLAERGIPHAYVPFEGEGHGFRIADNIRTALDGELYFYSRVFGFEAPRPSRVRVVGRLADRP